MTKAYLMWCPVRIQPTDLFLAACSEYINGLIPGKLTEEKKILKLADEIKYNIRGYSTHLS